jgi:hypothetical protein
VKERIKRSSSGETPTPTEKSPKSHYSNLQLVKEQIDGILESRSTPVEIQIVEEKEQEEDTKKAEPQNEEVVIISEEPLMTESDVKNITAETIIQDSRRGTFFRNFLESESANKELIFIIEVDQFKALMDLKKAQFVPKEDIIRLEAIYDKFLKKKSKFPVNVSKKNREMLKKAIQDPNPSKEIPVQILDEARVTHFTFFLHFNIISSQQRK